MRVELWAVLWDGGKPSVKLDLLSGNRKLTVSWRLRWLLDYWRKLELVLAVRLKRARGQPPGSAWASVRGEARAVSDSH